MWGVSSETWLMEDLIIAGVSIKEEDWHLTWRSNDIPNTYQLEWCEKKEKKIWTSLDAQPFPRHIYTIQFTQYVLLPSPAPPSMPLLGKSHLLSVIYKRYSSLCLAGALSRRTEFNIKDERAQLCSMSGISVQWMYTACEERRKEYNSYTDYWKVRKFKRKNYLWNF